MNVMVRWIIVAASIAAAAVTVSAGDGGVVRVGGDVVIDAGERVREAVVVGGSLTVKGEVENDAVAVGGSLFLAPGASVGGSAVAIGGKIHGARRARIGKDRVEVNVPGIASVLGVLSGANWLAIAAGMKVFSLIGLAVIAVVLTAVFPGPLGAVADVVDERPFNAVFAGLVGVVLIVPTAVLLVISVVGIVLVPLEVIVVASAFTVGYIAVSRFIGRRIALSVNRPALHPMAQTLIGVAALSLAAMVPLVGWVVKTAAGLVGFGAVILAVGRMRTARRAAPPSPGTPVSAQAL